MKTNPKVLLFSMMVTSVILPASFAHAGKFNLFGVFKKSTVKAEEAKGTAETAQELANYTARKETLHRYLKPGEQRVLSDGRLFHVGKENTIQVHRAPGMKDGDLQLPIPDERDVIYKSTEGYTNREEMTDQFNFRRHLTKEENHGTEEIVFRSGGEAANRTIRWETQSGSMKSADVHTPRLWFNLQNRGDGHIVVNLSETIRTDAWVPKMSKDRTITAHRDIEIPEGSVLQSYELESGGKLQLKLRHSNGEYESKPISLVEGDASSSVPGLQKLENVNSVK